jgi:hypothetical protein
MNSLEGMKVNYFVVVDMSMKFVVLYFYLHLILLQQTLGQQSCQRIYQRILLAYFL